MAEQPWFKFFAADYLLDPDVDAMPREAEALLVRMWCVCHREGSCPADIEALARKTMCSGEYVAKYKAHCHRFFELRDGRLYSRRMDHEKQRSEQARANANSRFKSKADTESESERGSAIGLATCSAVGSVNGSANSTPNLHPLNYAAKICDELALPQQRQNIEAFASAIEALVKQGKSLAAAFEFLLARMKDAAECGELGTPIFWCRDGRYNVAPLRRALAVTARPPAAVGACQKCGGEKMLLQPSNVPGPRLIPCPDCSGSAPKKPGAADNSLPRKPAQDVPHHDSYIDGHQSVT